MINQPNNLSTKENPVGRFMVAAGAVIEHKRTGKILLIQRSADLDWHANEWEIDYGRIDQFEDAVTGLKRELYEEVGLSDLEIGPILSVWHMYRGPEKAENDLIGITYLCTTQTDQIKLSAEHQAYRWVTPAEALELVKIEGIRRDVIKYQEMKSASKAEVGKTVIGVGAGALIFNEQGKVLLSLRGKQAKNEVGKWEIPGGAIEFGETIEDGLKREVKEEIGIEIEIVEMLQVCNHILPEEHQHWVSPTYVCKIISGTPQIMEPDKSEKLEWFSIEEALQLPLSIVTRQDIDHLKNR